MFRSFGFRPRLTAACLALLLTAPAGCSRHPAPLYQPQPGESTPPATSFCPPADRYDPAQSRASFARGGHLGEDIPLPEGTPVRAIGTGRIVCYRAAHGYGELVVSIQHDMGKTLLFRLTRGGVRQAQTRYLVSIYGHLRPSRVRGKKPLGWREGDIVRKGDVIGYVNDARHNGRGGAHLHLGVRLMEYRGKWIFYGSRSPSARGDNYAAFSELLPQLPGGPNEAKPAALSGLRGRPLRP